MAKKLDNESVAKRNDKGENSEHRRRASRLRRRNAPHASYARGARTGDRPKTG